MQEEKLRYIMNGLNLNQDIVMNKQYMKFILK